MHNRTLNTSGVGAKSPILLEDNLTSLTQVSCSKKASAAKARAAGVSKDPKPTATPSQTLTLSGDCFWDMEFMFRQLPGVVSVEVGHTGASEPVVCEGHCDLRSPHAEAVNLRFDPTLTSTETLLKAYFSLLHLGNNRLAKYRDEGSQYRMGMYCHDESQKEIVNALVSEIRAATGFEFPFAIVDFEGFSPAKDESQDFYRNHPESTPKKLKQRVDAGVFVKPLFGNLLMDSQNSTLVTFANKPITSENVNAIRQALEDHAPHIKRLNARNCQLTDEVGFKLLQNLPAMSQLEHLNLNNNQLGDSSMTSIVTLLKKSCSNGSKLQTLQLSGNRFSTSGLNQLADALFELREQGLLPNNFELKMILNEGKETHDAFARLGSFFS